jgi:hypothetical protein
MKKIDGHALCEQYVKDLLKTIEVLREKFRHTEDMMK